MKRFETYLNEININPSIRSRIEDILDISKKILNEEEILDIFVSDYVTINSREYESLWIFTERYISEVKNFRSDYNFDMILRCAGFSYANIIFDKYDYKAKEASDLSRMKLSAVYSKKNITCIFKASGVNCRYLQEIFEKYFRANV